MKDNYKILVLSDLKETTENVLKSTVSLAKVVNADIEFFHIKKPNDVVANDNQLSAMRDINKAHLNLDKQITDLLTPLNKNYGLNIKFNVKIGHIKSEIEKRIHATQPDVIILGKRKPNAIKFVGDKVINYVLKQHQGAVLIAGNKNVLEPEHDLALGVFNAEKDTFNTSIVKDLILATKEPLKTFASVEKNNNSIENLSKDLLENNINLLCLNRGTNANKKVSKALSVQAKSVIKNLNVSVLLTNKNK